MRLAIATAAAVAVLLGLGASPAGASVYQRVLQTYEQEGDVPACAFSSSQLESALSDVDTYGAQYFADFTAAVQTALEARASGACSPGHRVHLPRGTIAIHLPASATSPTDSVIPGVLAVVAGLGIAAALLTGLAAGLRAIGFAPRWLRAWRHAWAEADYRLRARAEDLRDAWRRPT